MEWNTALDNNGLLDQSVDSRVLGQAWWNVLGRLTSSCWTSPHSQTDRELFGLLTGEISLLHTRISPVTVSLMFDLVS